MSVRFIGVIAHIPVRPQWTCAGCGGSWPCQSRRHQLDPGHTELTLTLYLAACMVEAAQDLPDVGADALYTRFLGWVRQ